MTLGEWQLFKILMFYIYFEPSGWQSEQLNCHCLHLHKRGIQPDFPEVMWSEERRHKIFVTDAKWTPVAASVAFQLSFGTAAIGQCRAVDSSLLLVGKEPDIPGQIRRFSYNTFTDQKPRLLNYNMMVYPVRTVADTLSAGQLKSQFCTMLQNKIHVHPLASPAPVLYYHTAIWKGYSLPWTAVKR